MSFLLFQKKTNLEEQGGHGLSKNAREYTEAVGAWIRGSENEEVFSHGTVDREPGI